MKTSRLHRVAGCLLVLLIPTAHADDAAGVLACMRANVPQTLQVQDIELAAIDQDGSERVLQGRIAATSIAAPTGKRLLRSTLQIRSPSSYAGAAYLIRESSEDREPGMYVYMPAVRRVRHVTGSFADGGLLGIDFSYRDFKQLQSAFAGESATLQVTERIESREAQRLSFNPQSSPDSPYSRVQVWVDKQSCVPVKAQFEQNGKLIKELTVPAASLRQAGARWYASEILMRNLKQGTHSALRLGKVTTPVSISDTLFDTTRFYLAAIH